MSTDKKFDPATPFSYRVGDEVWLDYLDPAERQKRDRYLAPTKAEYDALLSLEAAALSRAFIDAPRKPATYLGVIPEDTVVSLDHASKVFARRPDLFESDEEQPTTSRRRPTFEMPRDDFYLLYDSVLYANYLGRVMNFDLTVSWQKGGYAMPDDVDIGFSGFVERFRKFCQYWGQPAYYYAVFENGPTVGYHSHIHLHFPHELQPKLIEWLQSTLVTPNGDPFPRSCYEWKRHKDDHTVSQWWGFRYAVKALDPKFSHADRPASQNFKTFSEAVGVRHKPTGPLVIKRVRLAREIALAARKKARYYVKNLFSLPLEDRYGNHEYRRGIGDREFCLALLDDPADPPFGTD